MLRVSVVSGQLKIHMVNYLDKQGWIESIFTASLTQADFVYEDWKCVGIACYGTTQHRNIIITVAGE